MKQKIFSLQGIIFQERHTFGIGHKPGIGAAVMISAVMRYAMFHAVVGPNDEDPEIISGNMSDPWGESLIHDFNFSESLISFKKQYQRRPLIDYLFKEKKNGIWIGTWNGPDCGIGKTKMIITPLDESFFDYPDQR